MGNTPIIISTRLLMGIGSLMMHHRTLGRASNTNMHTHTHSNITQTHKQAPALLLNSVSTGALEGAQVLLFRSRGEWCRLCGICVWSACGLCVACVMLYVSVCMLHANTDHVEIDCIAL